MDMKKFNEEIDKFDLDSIDIADVEISELELKRIKNKAKRQCRISKTKKVGVVAAIAGIVVVGGIVTPAIAENVPFVKDIFYELGFFDKEIEEYIETVGQTRTNEYGETTLDNLVVTDNRVLVGMTYKSKEVIPENFDLERLRVTLPDTDGIFGVGGGVEQKKIDDYTVVITGDMKLIGGGLLKNKQMFVELELEGEYPEHREPNTVYYAQPPVSLGKFEVGAEFKDAIEEREIIELDIDKGEKGSELYENIVSLESNILGTTIYSKGDRSFDDGTQGEFGVSLIVDGIKYEVTGKSASQPENKKRQDQYVFETVKVNDIRNAKSIEIIVGKETHKIK
ncbi:MAG: DUF4179 domain-containing protein [Sarcina sp.]